MDDEYQLGVLNWMNECFGPGVDQDIRTRNFRFLEEALELVQAGGCSESEAHELVNYVFGRDQGDVNQEVGGVAVTLAALCNASNLSIAVESKRELDRIRRPEWMQKIKRKQAEKMPGGPLP